MAVNPFSPFGRGKGKEDTKNIKQKVKKFISLYQKIIKDVTPSTIIRERKSSDYTGPPVDEYGNVITEKQGRQTILERMGEEKSHRFEPFGENLEKLTGIDDEELQKIIYGRRNVDEILSQKEKEIKEQEEEIKEREEEVKGAKERTKLKLQQLKLKTKRQGIKALRKGIAALPESKKIEATDIDFIIILIFAIIVDSVDSILTILQILTAFTIGEVISVILDIITTAIISLWMFSRLKEIAQSKRARIAQLQKKMGEKAASMEKELVTLQKKAMRAPLRRVLLRIGAGFILEMIPFIGLIPWWTITVASTLREK